jgi:hypothetical protein
MTTTGRLRAVVRALQALVDELAWDANVTDDGALVVVALELDRAEYTARLALARLLAREAEIIKGAYADANEGAAVKEGS